MPPAMKKAPLKNPMKSRGRSTPPASRASKSSARTSVSVSRSRGRGGAKETKGRASQRDTVVARAALARKVKATRRSGGLTELPVGDSPSASARRSSHMPRPAAAGDAAEEGDRDSEQPESEADKSEDVDDEIEPSPFLDAAKEYAPNMKALENLSRGCMIEFGIFSPDWSLVGSGFGTVRHRDTLYTDGLVVTLSDVVGDNQHVQSALNDLKYGEERLMKLHLCSSDIQSCPAVEPKGELWLHSCIWRRRYTTDISPTSEEWIYRSLTAENMMMSGDPKFLRLQLEEAKRKAKARETSKPPAKVALTPRKETPKASEFLDVDGGRLSVVETRKRGLTPAPRVPPGRPIPVGSPRLSLRPDDASMRKLQEAGSKALLGHPSGNSAYPAGRYPQRPDATESNKASSSKTPYGSVGEALLQRAAQTSASAAKPGPPKDEGVVAPDRWIESVVRRKRSRSRRRRKSSQSSDEHDDDRQVFRSAPGRSSSSMLSVQEIASARPGALLQNGLSLMHEIANPTDVVSRGRQVLPQAARSYLTQVLQNLKGRSLTGRDRRELETLATGIDLLTAGKLDQMGDLLMQRFKSIETMHRDGSQAVGMMQELLPNYSDGATSLAEKEIASRQTLRQARVLDVMKAHSKSATE